MPKVLNLRIITLSLLLSTDFDKSNGASPAEFTNPILCKLLLTPIEPNGIPTKKVRTNVTDGIKISTSTEVINF